MGILTMATRSLVRRKTRTLIVIATLTFALTLITILPPSISRREELTQQTLEGMIGQADSLKETVTLTATEIEYNYHLSHKIVDYEENGQQMSDFIMQQQLLNESLLSKVFSIPDIVATVPTLSDYGTSRQPPIYGVAVDTDAYQKDMSLLPTNIVQGRNLQLGDRGVVVISEYIAKNATIADFIPAMEFDYEVPAALKVAEAEWEAKEYIFNVGDSFEVLGYKFIVVGIEKCGLRLSGHSITMSLVDAQTVSGKAGQASSCKVFVNDVDNVNSVVARIKALDSDLEVSSGRTQLNTVQPLQNQIEVLISAAQSNLDKTRGVGIVEIGVSVVAVVAVVLFMMLYSVRERTKEIGTLKAMGASTSRILGQFMLEGVLLCVVAAVIAVAISTFVLPQLSNLMLPYPTLEGVGVLWDANGVMGLSGVRTPVGATFVMPGEDISNIGTFLSVGWLLLSFGLAVGLGAVGSLYPALKAARTKPAEAMRYE